MKNNTNSYEIELRKAAEVKLRELKLKNAATVSPSKEDAPRLLDELQVHQIELEMQNELLIEAQSQAEEAYHQYSDLYEFAPVGYLTVTRSGTISKINLAGATMLGKPRNRLIDRMLAQFIPYGSLNTFEVFFNKLYYGNGYETCELSLLNNDNGVFWVQLEATRFVDGQECRVIMVDINERKLAEEHRQAEEILRASEAKFRNMFVNHAAVMLLMEPATGDIMDANIAAENFYGYPVPVLRTMNISDINTLTKEEIQIEMDGALHEHNNYFNFRHRLANGKIREVEVHSSPLTMENRTILFSIIHDVTEEKLAEIALAEAKMRLENIIEGTRVGTWEWNVQTGEVVFNELWAKMIGYTLEELEPISIKTWEKLSHSDDLNLSDELLRRHFAGELPYYDVEIRMKHKDGHWVWINDRGRIITRTDDGKPLLMFGSHHDITQRKREELLLSEVRLRLENIIEGAQIGTWEWNVQTEEAVINELGAQLIGYTLEELERISINTFEKLTHPDDLNRSDELLQRHFAGELPYYDVEVRMKHKDGHWVWIQDRGRIITRTDDGKPLLMFGTHTDITQRKQAELQLEEMAMTDFQTKLYNRRYFMQRSDEECKRARRNHQPLTLLMLDIDYFKKVNDTYGHEAGDQALQHVAVILKSGLREIDILGRMGGEEFAVLMPNTSLEDAVLLAERIRLSIANTPFITPAQELTLTVSIGAEIFTAEMSGIDELLRNADVALYRAKNSGRNCVVAYPSPYEEGIQTSVLGGT